MRTGWRGGYEFVVMVSRGEELLGWSPRFANKRQAESWIVDQNVIGEAHPSDQEHLREVS
jgi:hypothetical protein